MKLSKLSGGGRSPFDRRARERSPSAPAAVQSGWLLHGIPVYTAATLIIRVHFNVNKLLNPRRDTRVPLPARSPAPNVTYSLILDIVPNLRTSSPPACTREIHPTNRPPLPPTVFILLFDTYFACIHIIVYTTTYADSVQIKRIINFFVARQPSTMPPSSRSSQFSRTLDRVDSNIKKNNEKFLLRYNFINTWKRF